MNSIRRLRYLLFAGVAALAACQPQQPPDPYGLNTVPAIDDFCLAAQRVVTKTQVPMQLVVHDDFDAFVKSKAVIEGPEIQQFNWYDEQGNVLGVSCKLKSADHLNLEFGEGSAGPDGLCQDMNYLVYENVLADIDEPAFDPVIFDLAETVSNDEQPGMTGPDWLAPYTMTYVDDVGVLHVATKGFIVNFTDPQFERAPARFRGVHYCHLIAPDYMAGLLNGTAEANAEIGRLVDTSGPPPGNEPAVSAEN